MCRQNWFHYDLRVCKELQVHTKLRLASRLKYKNAIKLCKMFLSLMSHLAAHMLRQKWPFQFGNIWYITKNSNFKRHFF